MVANNRFVTIFLGLVLTSLVRGACDKSVVVENPAGLEAIKECKTFTGDIKITDKFAGVVSLPVLEKIVGELSIVSSAVNAIVLPQLTEATTFTLEHAQLNELHLKLSKVNSLTLNHLGGNFPVDITPGLDTAGVIRIIDSHIVSVKGLNVKEVSHLEVLSNTELKSLDLPNLESSKGLFSFQGNVKASLSAPKLVDVKGEFTVTKVHNLDLSKLTHASQMIKLSEANGKEYAFPELQYAHGGVIVENSPHLESLKFPNLEKILFGGFNLNNDPKLNVVEVPKLVEIDGGFVVSVPTLTDFKFNDKLTSKAGADIKSNVDCAKIDKLKSQFGAFKCEKSKEAVVILTEPVVTLPKASETPKKEDVKPATSTPAAPENPSSDAVSKAIPTLSAFALIALTFLH